MKITKTDKLHLDCYNIKPSIKYLKYLKGSMFELEQHLSKNNGNRIVDEELELVKVAIGRLILKMYERGLKT